MRQHSHDRRCTALVARGIARAAELEPADDEQEEFEEGEEQGEEQPDRADVLERKRGRLAIDESPQIVDAAGGPDLPMVSHQLSQCTLCAES